MQPVRNSQLFSETVLGIGTKIENFLLLKYTEQEVYP
jgi:hypothetical protein